MINLIILYEIITPTRLLKAAGTDGKEKILNAFYANHPHIPKRQVELKIGEIAIKEKRPDGWCKNICWYVLPEFEKYLDMENLENSTPIVPKIPAKPLIEEVNAVQREDSSSAAKSTCPMRPRERDIPGVTTTHKSSIAKTLDKARYFHTHLLIRLPSSCRRFLSSNLFQI